MFQLNSELDVTLLSDVTLGVHSGMSLATLLFPEGMLS